MSIRYVRAHGYTREDMIEHVRKSPLYQHGDCILVWVNEGDFWGAMPEDVEASAAIESKERAEYARLKAKFEPRT